jgi:uncharacterized membrane protein
MPQAIDRHASSGRLVPAIGAVLLFATTYGTGYLSLGSDQLWIFERVMGLMGLGLFLVFASGIAVGDRVSGALTKLDDWILAKPTRAGTLLAVMIFTYVVSWCGLSFLRHYYFHSSYDLGIMDQVVWNTAQGNLFARSIEVTNDLGDHVRLYLAALSLIYLAIPSPYVLLTFQSLVLGLTAWPLYKLARRKLDSPAIGLAAACCVLAYPPLGFLNRYDFHIEVVSVPLLVAAFERIDSGDLKSAGVLMALTLFCKENLGVTVAALGLMTGLYYKHWRFGLTWVMVGLSYSSIALLVVIPAFRGEPSDTLSRYYWLGDTPYEMLWTALSQPAFVLRRIFVAEHVLTLLQLFAPLAFLPLFGLPALLPAVPALIYNFLAEWHSQGVIYQHYMAPVIPFVLVSAVLGLRCLASSAWVAGFLDANVSGAFRFNRSIGVGAGMMLAAIVTSWIYQNPITGNASLVWGRDLEMVPIEHNKPVPMIWPNDAAIRQGLKLVPAKTPVLTTTNYAPHLSHRPWIEMVPRAPVQALDPKAEVIFLNLRDLRFWNCVDYLETLKAARESNFGVIFYRDEVLVIQKAKGDKGKLHDLLSHWSGCE